MIIPNHELTIKLRQQQILADFGVFALKADDLEPLLQEASRLCAEGLQCKFCKIMEYLVGEDALLVRAGVGWQPGVVGHATLRGDVGSPAGYAFKTQRPVVSNHLIEETRFRTPELLARHGIKRAINVPLGGASERFGILEVDASDEGQFTEHDLTFLQGFANTIGIAIESTKAKQDLKEALQRQEVLTLEVGHRVKNGLSMVASLLNMQRRAASEASVQQALAEAGAMVQTVVQVHDRLLRMENAQSIELSDFISELCALLTATSPGPSLTCHVDPVAISGDKAIPVGLITIELVTNAFKYAYPTGQGRVEVNIGQIADNEVLLGVRDYGVGSASMTGSNGLGTKLISALVRQLGGRGEWRDANPGTEFRLNFGISRPPAKST